MGKAVSSKQCGAEKRLAIMEGNGGRWTGLMGTYIYLYHKLTSDASDGRPRNDDCTMTHLSGSGFIVVGTTGELSQQPMRPRMY